MKKKFPKLSSLIAAGSRHWKQAFGLWARKNSSGEDEKCALETAIATAKPLEKYGEKKLRRTPSTVASLCGLKDEALHCPVEGCGCTFKVTELAMHLNDQHEWSRERIADFLAKKGF